MADALAREAVARRGIMGCILIDFVVFFHDSCWGEGVKRERGVMSVDEEVGRSHERRSSAKQACQPCRKSQDPGTRQGAEYLYLRPQPNQRKGLVLEKFASLHQNQTMVHGELMF